ncbi:MAG TPA: class I adenylate-forming enzyme family protein [Xanthobacteraceae bacterium]|jgi:acyl-coenzyme A synthetase/AMP-(fatty) acid ligase|nr:class I adenylate-forming enzyme family protein [Xanthobacteraceae bacterium]
MRTALLTKAPSLRQRVRDGFFRDRSANVRVADLVRGTSLRCRLPELAGKSVAIATGSQLTAGLALIELDGVARRLLILPPDVDPSHLPALFASAEIDAVVTDGETAAHPEFDLPLRVDVGAEIALTDRLPEPARDTEWVMLTSGTTGVPKLLAHSLAALTGAIKPAASNDLVVWGTFYDIRRYGGLQIFLRAVLGGASLVLSRAGEPIADHLDRLAQYGVTHLSGTPSHWRRALMSPDLHKIVPRYVRLSGEIADQTVLDSLRTAFPSASVGHAYASTEAGVAFEVTDGLAGMPQSYFDVDRDGVEMKIEDGSLRIRSPRRASHYIGSDAVLTDADGFVDSGDMLELRGDRYVFAGRRGGIINIGGLKVHPEEIEAVINRHPKVRMSLVRPKASPITGAIVIADVVLESGAAVEADEIGVVKGDILKLCRDTLPRHKVPAAISIVPSLDVAATGKLARRHKVQG